VRAHADTLRHLRSGAPPLTLNCGYGHGFSVLEVIDAVKRASGVDFKVEVAPRRPGDPARIVADCRQARATLGWQPRSDDFPRSSPTHWPGNANLLRAAHHER
jgi:UDP-glucose 4-epimerase